MLEFKWLTAVINEQCVMCHRSVKAGDGFYFEVSNRAIYCRECGRDIRKNGFEQAMIGRTFGSIFKSVFGEDFKL
jgi:NAD-dependent SIR2 family protein deacetylase